jgi:drug/metabolite transporter (DMT)-like permease
MGEHLSRKGLMHLFVVYTVWSTTYLAMRIGVDAANGFPPFAFGALRMIVAAVILLAIARIQKQRIIPTWSELFSLAAVGNLLWLGGNGLVLWAEQYVSSGFACLLVSSAPIWATIIELFIYKKTPTAILVFSLIVGFSGVAVLSVPSLRMGSSNDTFAVVSLLLSAICWALGSVFQSRRPVNLAPQVMSGYHQLAAFFGFSLVSSALGEPLPHPTTAAWLAWGYLVVFGSVCAFTSYVFTLRLLPINIAMTYAYVNPALALFLGWLLLNEPISIWTLLGALLVVVSVFGIFSVKHQVNRQAPGEGRTSLQEEA